MSLGSSLSELIALFNAQKTDLPAEALHRNCTFRLNGRAYHETLGRPLDDPLVRLIGCGPAAYRLVVTALRYALAHPRIRLEPIDAGRHDGRQASLSARAMLTGTLRGTDQPLRAECALSLNGEANGRIHEIAVTMGDADVELLLAARQRS